MSYKFPKDKGQDIYDAIVDVNGGGDFLTLKDALDGGARSILLKSDDTSIVSDGTTACDLADGELLEIIGVGNPTISIDTGSGPIFTWSTATPLLNIGLVVSGTAVDIALNRFYTDADQTANVIVGDLIGLGNYIGASPVFFTVTSVTATYIEVAENLALTFSADIVDTGPTLQIARYRHGGPGVRFRNVKIVDTTGSSEVFHGETYPCFSEFTFENCDLHIKNFNYDYQQMPGLSYFRSCKLSWSTNVTWYFSGVIDNCTLSHVLVVGAVWQYNAKFIGGSDPTGAFITSVWESYYISNIKFGGFIGCNFNGTTTPSMNNPLYSTRFVFKGNSGMFLDNGTGPARDAAAILNPQEYNNWVSKDATGVLAVDEINILTTQTSPITLTIPTLVITRAGSIITIKDTGNAAAHNITIATEGAETIDGADTITLNQNYAAVKLVSDGTNLYIT